MRLVEIINTGTTMRQIIETAERGLDAFMEAGTWRYPEDRPRPSDWDLLLRTQRELEGLRPAMRDPKTGKIYVGSSHQAAINQIPWNDETGAYGRLFDAWDKATEDAGFIDRDGNFVSRDEAAKRWDVLTIEDVRDRLKALRGGKARF